MLWGRKAHAPLCDLAADYWFKVYAVPSFRTWSSYGPLSQGDSQSFHLLSSTELTVGSSFIHSFVWEDAKLPLLIGKQGLNLCICIQAAPGFSFQELQPSEPWGSAEWPCLLPSHTYSLWQVWRLRSSRMWAAQGWGRGGLLTGSWLSCAGPFGKGRVERTGPAWSTV